MFLRGVGRGMDSCVAETHLLLKTIALTIEARDLQCDRTESIGLHQWRKTAMEQHAVEEEVLDKTLKHTQAIQVDS